MLLCCSCEQANNDDSPAQLPEFQRVAGFKFLIGGMVGEACNIEVSPTVGNSLASWPVLGTVTNVYGVAPFLDAQALTNGMRFYRAQQTSP